MRETSTDQLHPLRHRADPAHSQSQCWGDRQEAHGAARLTKLVCSWSNEEILSQRKKVMDENIQPSPLGLCRYTNLRASTYVHASTHAQMCTQARTYHGLHRGRELLFRNGESKHFRYGAFMFQYRLHFLHHKSTCPLHPGHTGISCTLNVFPQGSPTGKVSNIYSKLKHHGEN